jgi:hypothetical protein
MVDTIAGRGRNRTASGRGAGGARLECDVRAETRSGKMLTRATAGPGCQRRSRSSRGRVDTANCRARFCWRRRSLGGSLERVVAERGHEDSYVRRWRAAHAAEGVPPNLSSLHAEDEATVAAFVDVLPETAGDLFQFLGLGSSRRFRRCGCRGWHGCGHGARSPFDEASAVVQNRRP